MSTITVSDINLVNPNGQNLSPAERLRQTAAAVRVQFTWMGVRKTVSESARESMAEAVQASEGYVSATKKIIDTKSKEFKGLTAVRSKIVKYWKAVTLPYVENGVRLMPQDKLDSFVAQLTDFRIELQDAVAVLADAYDRLKNEAKGRLGELYDEADYPEDVRSLFSVEWDFPSVEPPSYLMQVRPDLYAAEQQRVAARFEEAVRLAEVSFTQELAALVQHMAERLSPAEDGIKKVFRDSAIENFNEFFQKFRSLNVNSNHELNAVVARAQNLLQGVNAKDLRSAPEVQSDVRLGLVSISAALDGLVVSQPRRKIIRPSQQSSPRTEGGES